VTREARNAPGDFEIYVAHSSAEIELAGKLSLQ